ncbi:MAG: hypothetical protein A2583_05125 [Bdellovibrionales bacterium RIFOXYD1_FULL_53_11]|nr:MAG: hypothetical protein A2583_05125 [Bdellovibrionales bacterium RIFOXYD1_FULL_53_11]
MKIFTFRYEKNPHKKALAAMNLALKTGKPDIRENELICDSMDTMLKIMPKSRFDVFAAIVEHKPKSIYALAQVMKKDQANVLRDVKALADIGLIKLKTIKNGNREKMTPEPLYDKVVFEFEPKKLASNE